MRRQGARRMAAAALALAAGSGCCRHYCQPMYADPCSPAVVQSQPMVRRGEVCQTEPHLSTPSEPGGGSRVRIVSEAPPPRIVVSEPGRSGLGGWRKADPESTAITKVEGAVSSDSLKR